MVTRKIWIALAALVFVGPAAFLLLRGWYSHITDFLSDIPFVTTVSEYLTLFMVILVIRYFLLIMFSYLEHLDNIKKNEIAKTTGGATPESDHKLPFITIVVPAYNEGRIIQTAIRSLLEIDYPHYEVLVVDDGSTDDTYERACEMINVTDKCIVTVLTKANAGKANALNTGMGHAKGDFILNMDGDSKLSPNTLRDCIRHFDDPKIGAVAGNVKVVNRDNAITRVQALEYVEGLALLRKAQSYARMVNIIPGPLGMFRKSALRQVRGYDDDTFAEDCDLTLKLLFEGWHIIYEPRAIAWVETPSHMIDLLKQRYRWTRGILQAIKKHAWSLRHPHKAGANGFILWYMLFEGVLCPISNVTGNIFFVWVGFKYDLTILVAFWWLQLTILDLATAAYCVIIEKEDTLLIVYALVLRIFYQLFVDVAKILASIEELAGAKMSWGKLEREGKL
ncbi:MAG TPA: glycosyltransferase [Gallionellaceae bacterium]|nr:glycosyltransferase [Gallionellaceae bacterium]